MRSGISLREDFDGEGLRRLARQTKDAVQARRLLALASIYDGGSRSDAARLGSVTLQIVRDWVMRFNEHGPQGLINGKAPGPQSRLNDQQRAALAQAIERGPTPYLDGVVRWRLCDLAQWLWEEFRVSVSEQTLSRWIGDHVSVAIRPATGARAKETQLIRAEQPPLNIAARQGSAGAEVMMMLRRRCQGLSFKSGSLN